MIGGRGGPVRGRFSSSVRGRSGGGGRGCTSSGGRGESSSQQNSNAGGREIPSRDHYHLEDQETDDASRSRESHLLDDLDAPEGDDVLSNPPATDNRIRLTLAEDGKTFLPYGTSAQLKFIFTQKICDNAFRWCKLPKARKLDYYNEFKKYYVWDPSQKLMFKKAWNTVASTCYARLMCNWKRNFDSGNGKPEALDEVKWKQWQVWYKSDEYLKLSKTNKKNRLTEVEGPRTGVAKHRGGSIPAVVHKQRLREELGRQPTDYEVFLKLTVSKDDIPVDEHKKKIKERMEERIAEYKRNGQEFDMHQLFLEVNPATKKQCRTGLGSAVSSSTGINSNGSNINSNVTEELTLLREQLMAKDEAIREMKEKQEQFEQKQQAVSDDFAKQLMLLKTMVAGNTDSRS